VLARRSCRTKSDHKEIELMTRQMTRSGTNKRIEISTQSLANSNSPSLSRDGLQQSELDMLNSYAVLEKQIASKALGKVVGKLVAGVDLEDLEFLAIVVRPKPVILD
jgi:hypothetical protein